MRHPSEALALGTVPAACLASAALIYWTPAIFGFASAALAAFAWCWWTDAHPAG
jgi:hypothetical protein